MANSTLLHHLGGFLLFYGSVGNPPALRFDMQIFNHHESLGLEVENANLLVNLDGRYLGEAGLNIPYVAPNTAVILTYCWEGLQTCGKS
jgi:hypothetical protein